MKYEEKYKTELAKHLKAKSNQISLYWKGRVGLYSLLKAMGVGHGDEVIIPAFTCVVVPNAILYLGATPVYVDISDEHLNTTLTSIQSGITNKTKCIIVQNTFGLSSEVDSISDYAREKKIFTIEDCTHGFGGSFEGKPNGTYCDAAFYSTQWNKPFSTGIGGFTLLNNEDFEKSLNTLNQDLLPPTVKQRQTLGMLIRVRKFMLHDSTYWPLLRLYRSWSKKGAVVGSSSSQELETIDMPTDYFMKSSNVQERVGIQSLKSFDELMTLRKENGLLYNDFMRKHGQWNYPDKILHNHSFLKYPVFVKDKSRFMQKAEKAKVRLGDWFLSPIHPVTANFHQWKLSIKEFPKAQFYAQHILNLPTDTKNPQKTLDFLLDNMDELIIWGKQWE